MDKFTSLKLAFVSIAVFCLASIANAEFVEIGTIGDKLILKDDDFSGAILQCKSHCYNNGYDLLRIESEAELSFLMQSYTDHLSKNYWLDAQAKQRTPGQGCFTWFDSTEMPAFLRPYTAPEDMWGVGLQYIPTMFGSDLPQVPFPAQGFALCSTTTRARAD